jgi:tetratricopeptide (TPR) repeat protein
VWSGEGNSFHPKEGYCWESDPPSESGFRVKPLPEGTPHPTLPNVVWSGDGHSFHAAPGYTWVNPTDETDYRVKPLPATESRMDCASADTLAQNGKFDEAAELYRKAVALNPENGEAYSGLGLALIKQGNYDEAQAACRKALELNPKDPHAYNNLGVTLQKQGRLAEAREAFEQALQIAPDMAAATQNLQGTEAKIIVGKVISEAARPPDTTPNPEPHSLYRVVDGKLVEFTVADNSAVGPTKPSEQLTSAAASGQRAQNAGSPEAAAKDLSNLGWDTPNSQSAGLTFPKISGTVPAPAELALPEKCKAIPAVHDLLERKEKADEDYKTQAESLKVINDKIAASQNEEEKKALQVEAVNAMTEMNKDKSASWSAVANIQKYFQVHPLDLTQVDDAPKGETPPAAPAAPQTAPSAGGTQESLEHAK